MAVDPCCSVRNGCFGHVFVGYSSSVVFEWCFIWTLCVTCCRSKCFVVDSLTTLKALYSMLSSELVFWTYICRVPVVNCRIRVGLDLTQCDACCRSQCFVVDSSTTLKSLYSMLSSALLFWTYICRVLVVNHRFRTLLHLDSGCFLL